MGTTCFECLERQINEDFSSSTSSSLIFLHGVSDSGRPFGSAAAVQLNLRGSGDEQSTGNDVSIQFVLERVDLSKQLDGNLDLPTDGYKEDGASEVKQTSSPESGEYQGVDSAKNMQSYSTTLGPQFRENIHEDNKSAMEPDDFIGKIKVLAPDAYIRSSSFTEFENIASSYISGAIEDHVILSIKALMEGKHHGIFAAEFLSLIGMPAFDENKTPRSVRHPNIIPVLGMLESASHASIMYPKAQCSLLNILHYSPNVLKSDWNIRFLAYQIVSALSYLHNIGIGHGDLHPENIMLTDSCWSWLKIHEKHLFGKNFSLKKLGISSSRTLCDLEHCPCHSLYAELKLSTPIDWQCDFKRWWVGELSNYDYLLVLNRLAGRRWGDHSFHTVMPWVIDFSVKPDENSDAGWRDLQKSKWRLAKGDEQLDFTYSTSEIPHHISDECLSELAVCSYKARRLPLNILRSAVRSVYEPNEYPSNMQRLYQWTPDECIPEFYSDPRIFSSLHCGMNDLTIPSWAATPAEFIALHRAALESERVSQMIHNWIDITFGYKLTGHASIIAKNVMLSASDPSPPKSTGRRQLFKEPHPARRGSVQCPKESRAGFVKQDYMSRDFEVRPDFPHPSGGETLLHRIHHLQKLEEAVLFCEHAQDLCPIYAHQDIINLSSSSSELSIEEPAKELNLMTSGDCLTSDVNLQLFLENLETGTVGGYQELLRWKHSSSKISSKEFADDIFSVGCILAELYLKKPLFDPISFAAYVETGRIPGYLLELPPHVALVVEHCIERDWKRRPSAKCLLESPFFPPTIHSAYLFLAPLHLLAKTENLLSYAAKIVNAGAFKAMGSFVLEMCAPYCIPIVIKSLSDVESESAVCLLKEFFKCLKPEGIQSLILPAIQKILQAPEYSHVKVSLLQESFVQEVWKHVGKQVYLEKLHPLVILSLCNSPAKLSSSAASVLLLCLSEDLGIPITINQTILPLMCCFGKGLSGDGIDALVRIGGLLGENFITRHLLPLVKSFVMSCSHVPFTNRPEPLQSWISLALIDSFSVLDGLITTLPRNVILKEVVLDLPCVHIKVLMQSHLDLLVTQVVATGLMTVCKQIGADFTVLHVLPQLKDLFDELGFSKEASEKTHSCIKHLDNSAPKLDEQMPLRRRMDLVFLLYPFFASLVGIEKLRQCCATWLLLEHYLQHFHKWKWEFAGKSSANVSESTGMERHTLDASPVSDYSKLLLDGVGWSMPQTQVPKANRFSNDHIKANFQQTSTFKDKQNSSYCNSDPWFWFPNASSTWDGPDFLGRLGGLREELPWKVKASILHSARAHPGSLRSLAVCSDECVVFTGGVGPGLKGTVQKWELAGVNCVSGYYGHEEIVNDICTLSISGRIASCDGTIHIWNSQTSKLIAAYAESSSAHHSNAGFNASRSFNDQANMLTSTVLSDGVLSSTLNGNLYTRMHFLASDSMLVGGMGNGSIRFIDITHDRKLHLWKSYTLDFTFSSVVSAICSCDSGNQAANPSGRQSVIAVGSSSGQCRLLDRRSGEIIDFWRAHDGYITKLAGPEDHLLVSSSLDKTIRVWDLRRNMSSQSNIFRGHSDGISSFAVWGKDVISVSRSNIGISSLLRAEGGPWPISPQKLYSADRGSKNLSVLTAISVLPYSRLFVVGTDDGYLKICC